VKAKIIIKDHLELKRILKANDMAYFLFYFEQVLRRIVKDSPETNVEVTRIQDEFYSLLADNKINIEDLNN
jgi:hypothetical protein